MCGYKYGTRNAGWRNERGQASDSLAEMSFDSRMSDSEQQDLDPIFFERADVHRNGSPLLSLRRRKERAQSFLTELPSCLNLRTQSPPTTPSAKRSHPFSGRRGANLPVLTTDHRLLHIRQFDQRAGLTEIEVGVET